MKILLAIITLTIFSCGSHKEDAIDHAHTAGADTSLMQHSPNAKKLFQDVKFDDRYDLSCGMPLTAGLTDSAHYQRKIYGFCSPECKADFRKNAKELIAKRKK